MTIQSLGSFLKVEKLVCVRYFAAFLKKSSTKSFQAHNEAGVIAFSCGRRGTAVAVDEESLCSALVPYYDLKALRIYSSDLALLSHLLSQEKALSCICVKKRYLSEQNNNLRCRAGALLPPKRKNLQNNIRAHDEADV